VDPVKVGLVDKPSTPRERARRLRHEQTEAERFLWARLRARQLSGAKFRRQCPIGPFIADFCCLEHRLIVELDGGQHASEVEKDEARSDFLRKQGYEVLRFWDHEVFLETEAVLQRIADLLAARDAE
jgi:very-short-patch-repair endonuclease